MQASNRETERRHIFGKAPPLSSVCHRRRGDKDHLSTEPFHWLGHATKKRREEKEKEKRGDTFLSEVTTQKKLVDQFFVAKLNSVFFLGRKYL